MTDLSKSEPIDRWENSAHPSRRCTAHRKNGDQCKNAARHGTSVCDFHGAKAPQVKRKARQRLEEAADRMACELLKMATADDVADSVKLAAIRDALDRGGLGAKSAAEVEMGPPKPYEQIFGGIIVLEGGSRESFRRSQAALESGANDVAVEESSHDIQFPTDGNDSPDTVLHSTKQRKIRRRQT